MRDPYKRQVSNRKHQLRTKYGLSFSEYLNVLERQDYVCAICKITPLDSKLSFTVDHCHKTGLLRGVLCYSCNSGLGYFRDSQVNLIAACSYLKEAYDKKNPVYVPRRKNT